MPEIKRTIGTKLFATFGAAIAAAVLLGIISILTLSRMNSNFDDVVNRTARTQMLASLINTDITEMISLVRGMEVRALLKDHAQLSKYQKSYQDDLAKLNKEINELAPMIVTPQGKEFLGAVREGAPRLSDFDLQIYDKLSTGDIDGGVALYKDQFQPFAAHLQDQAFKFLEFKTVEMDQTSKKTKALEAEGRWLTIGMLFVCCVVGGVVVYVVRQINEDLRLTALSLSDGAEQIAAAANQVSGSSQAVAQGSSDQAAFIQETSASSEEVSSRTRRNTESTTSAASIVHESEERFEAANRSLTEMVAAMDGITSSSEQISRIIKVIDKIAFQTNILALNAAVESARAGEAGMGFAVVAEEVRNLAHRSAEAAKDTASLIEASIERSRDGKIKMDEVATAIRLITSDSSKVKTLVDEVNVGSQEQSRGIEQISKAIRKMEQITQGNAASAEQTAAAAEQLTAQSKSVREIVVHLSAMVGSTAAFPTTAHSSSSVNRRPLVRPGRATKSFAGDEESSGFKASMKMKIMPKLSKSTAAKQVDPDFFQLDDSEFKEF